MVYATPTTRATGYVVLATNWNEFVNNFIAMAPDAFTADGDIYIASAANVGVKLAAFSSSTGVLKRAYGGLEVALSDPDADRILFWDDDAGDYAYLTPGTNLEIDGTTMNASGAVAATQAEMEAASSTTVFVVPGRTKYHPGVAKAWCRIDADGTLTAGSYNIHSIGDTGPGDRLVNILIDFADGNYAVSGMVSDLTSGTQRASNYAGDSFRLRVENTSGTLADGRNSIVCHGDQ